MSTIQDEISYANIVYSKRKTLCISVNRMGEVVFRAPFGTSIEKISEFASLNEEWMQRTVSEILQRRENYKKIQGLEGESFLFLGKSYEIVHSTKGIAKFYGLKVIIPSSPNPLVSLVNLLKAEAHIFLENRLETISNKYKIPYKEFRLSRARRRWGSCSHDNAINLSWRLAMCPANLIDYVIIHELCHTIHKNHSSAFWQEVSYYLPNSVQLREELSDYEFVMEYFD